MTKRYFQNSYISTFESTLSIYSCELNFWYRAKYQNNEKKRRKNEHLFTNPSLRFPITS